LPRPLPQVIGVRQIIAVQLWRRERSEHAGLDIAAHHGLVLLVRVFRQRCFVSAVPRVIFAAAPCPPHPPRQKPGRHGDSSSHDRDTRDRTLSTLDREP